MAVYNSYGSSGGQNWHVIGGTSAGAPIIAGLFAVAGNTSVAYNGRYLMRHASSLWDITFGSNGTCVGVLLYLCRAGIGYDGPTGLGTPRGIGAF